MKLFIRSLLATLLVGAVGALTISPALAHEGAPIMGRSVSPSTSVPTHPRFELRQYFDTHPQVLNMLAKDPSLVNKPLFLKRHGRLEAILASNTKLAREFHENPQSMVNKYRMPHQDQKDSNWNSTTDSGTTMTPASHQGAHTSGTHGVWGH